MGKPAERAWRVFFQAEDCIRGYKVTGVQTCALPISDDSGVPAPAVTPSALLHEASLKTETREVPARSAVALPLTAAISTDKPATAAKPARAKSVRSEERRVGKERRSVREWRHEKYL